MADLRILRLRFRWLRVRLTVAEWFLPPGARTFGKLSKEAADLVAAAEAHLRQCEAALNDG